MAKNLLGKSRTIENPYATFEGYSVFGDSIAHLLKTYQKPENEIKNQYGRWFIAAKTDHTFGSFDMGDTYIHEAVRGLQLTFASDEFKENYWDQLDELKQVTGFRTI